MNVQKMGPTDCFEMALDKYDLLLKQCVYMILVGWQLKVTVCQEFTVWQKHNVVFYC